MKCNFGSEAEGAELDQKIAEVRALAAELRRGAEELEHSADEWDSFNAGSTGLPSAAGLTPV